jgi:NitT/TauT family transport system permease protein
MPVSPDVDPTAAAARIERHDHGPLIDTMLLIVGLLVLWQAGSMLLGHEALPSPAATVMKLASILGDSDFPAHAWETARAFVTALVIALCSGLAIGLALGANRLSGEVAEPLLVGLYAIPKITLYPVILLLFGLGISAKIAFGVIHGVIPVIVFTMNAVRNIKGVYFRAARTMRLSLMQTAVTIVVPAAMPEIISGFRVGFALTLLGTLIGEMFASQRGIGYMLVRAMETNDTLTVMALAFLLVVLATAASTALLALDRRLHKRAMPS